MFLSKYRDLILSNYWKMPVGYGMILKIMRNAWQTVGLAF